MWCFARLGRVGTPLTIPAPTELMALQDLDEIGFNRGAIITQACHGVSIFSNVVPKTAFVLEGRLSFVSSFDISLQNSCAFENIRV